jgi:hypothetical protein
MKKLFTLFVSLSLLGAAMLSSGCKAEVAADPERGKAASPALLPG